MLMWEHEYPIWEKFYPRGSPILDIGADPESVRFFENRGQLVYPLGDSYGIHIGAIKIDIDGGEWGLVVETHAYKPKLKMLYDMGGGTRIYRLERGRRLTPSNLHLLKVKIAHWIRRCLNHV